MFENKEKTAKDITFSNLAKHKFKSACFEVVKIDGTSWRSLATNFRKETRITLSWYYIFLTLSLSPWLIMWSTSCFDVEWSGGNIQFLTSSWKFFVIYHKVHLNALCGNTIKWHRKKHKPKESTKNWGERQAPICPNLNAKFYIFNSILF